MSSGWQPAGLFYRINTSDLWQFCSHYCWLLCKWWFCIPTRNCARSKLFCMIVLLSLLSFCLFAASGFLVKPTIFPAERMGAKRDDGWCDRWRKAYVMINFALIFVVPGARRKQRRLMRIIFFAGSTFNGAHFIFHFMQKRMKDKRKKGSEWFSCYTTEMNCNGDWLVMCHANRICYSSSHSWMGPWIIFFFRQSPKSTVVVRNVTNRTQMTASMMLYRRHACVSQQCTITIIYCAFPLIFSVLFLFILMLTRFGHFSSRVMKWKVKIGAWLRRKCMCASERSPGHCPIVTQPS